MARSIGGGDTGTHLDIPCWPDSTFKDEIDALIAAGTAVEGSKLVTFTFSNNYEVTSAADGAVPDGKVIKVEKDATNGYLLTVRVFHVTDQNSGHFNPVEIISLPNSDGTIALQDSMIVYGTTYMYVDDGGAGGTGVCVSIDSTNLTADFLV